MTAKRVYLIAAELNLETDWVIHEMDKLGIHVTNEDSEISQEDEHRYIEFKFEDLKKQQSRYDEIQQARREAHANLALKRKKKAS